MPASPYAKLLVSVDGGTPTSGPITATEGQTLQFSIENPTGVTQGYRWVLYDFPPDFPEPSGWSTDQSDGTFYSLAATPPVVTISQWGKFLPALFINGATNTSSNPRFRDTTGTAIKVLSPNVGMPGISGFELQQFEKRGAFVDLMRCLQAFEEFEANAEGFAAVLGISNDGDGEQIKNIANPTDNQDAATKVYVDSTVLQDFAGVLSQDPDGGGIELENIGAPTSGGSAANRSYVESAIGVFRVDAYKTGGNTYDDALALAKSAAESAGGGRIRFETSCTLATETSFSTVPIHIQCLPGVVVTQDASAYGLSLFQIRTPDCSVAGTFVCGVATIDKGEITGSSYDGQPPRDRAAAVYVGPSGDRLKVSGSITNFVSGVTLHGTDVSRVEGFVADVDTDTCTFGVLGVGLTNANIRVRNKDTDNTQPSAPPHAVYVSNGGFTLPSQNVEIIVDDNGNNFSSPGKMRGVQNGSLIVRCGPSVRGADVTNCDNVTVTVLGTLTASPGAVDTSRAGVVVTDSTRVTISDDTHCVIETGEDAAFGVNCESSPGAVIQGSYEADRTGASTKGLIRVTTSDGVEIRRPRMTLGASGGRGIEIISGDDCLIDDPRTNTQASAVRVSSGVNDTIVRLSSALITGFSGAAVTDSGTSTRVWTDGLEYGTFTPALTFSTPGDLSVIYTIQTGQWYRIGNVVHFELEVRATPTYTTASGALRISGLPFTALNSAVPYYACSIGRISNLTYSTSPLIAAVPESTAYVSITRAVSASTEANVTLPTGTDLTLNISGRYRVSW